MPRKKTHPADKVARAWNQAVKEWNAYNQWLDEQVATDTIVDAMRRDLRLAVRWVPLQCVKAGIRSFNAAQDWAQLECGDTPTNGRLVATGLRLEAGFLSEDGDHEAASVFMECADEWDRAGADNDEGSDGT